MLFYCEMYFFFIYSDRQVFPKNIMYIMKYAFSFRYINNELYFTLLLILNVNEQCGDLEIEIYIV